MKCLVAMAFAAFLVSGPVVRAAGPDEQYVGIYGLIQEADKLSAAGQTRIAVTKYLEAQTGLKNLQTASPDWNPKIVSFRLQYIASKLEPLAQKPAAAVAGPASPTVAPGQDLTNRLVSLQEDMARLANQNALLEAKLREALTVQPASSDPRELARAEERIKQLQKERDLLAANLEQARGQSPKPAPSATQEKQSQTNDELKQQLVMQTAIADVLRKENEELQKQVAGTGARRKQAGGGAGSPAQIMNLKENVAMLQASNRVLQSEQLAMENKLLDWVRRYGANGSAREKQWETQLAAAYADAAAAKKERDELIVKLNNVAKESNERTTPSGSANAELEHQLEALRAKVQIFETKAAPYTTEELALFKQPPPKESAVETNKPMMATFAADTNKPAFAAAAVVSKPPTEKKRDELPPGTGPLIAAAERAVDSGRYEEAERRFAEILRQDESNVYLRSRLAASQLDQNKLAEAEANLKQALASDPDHAPSLAMMGDLRFRQEKYDEAIEALGLAAKARPDRPDTHYMLGRALIQKGNRAPAEAALRKAVQLKPGWGEPHYQLAVLYATQKPSFPELAQYHYKKAIAGGIPRNLEFEKFMEKPLTAKVP